MYVDQICKSYVLKVMCKLYVPDMWLSYIMISYIHTSGAVLGFQVRGGALKKIAPSGGGAFTYDMIIMCFNLTYDLHVQGRIQGGGRRAPLKLEKIRFFGVKS
jgi:hypothetical protein